MSEALARKQETAGLLENYWLSKIYSGGDKLAQMEEINEMSDEEWLALLEVAKTSPPILAFLALYPRFWPKKAPAFYKMLEETRSDRLSKKLPAALDGRSSEELIIILTHLSANQISYGCTGACSFCDVAAPYPRVDGEDSLEHMPARQMEELYWQHYFLKVPYLGNVQTLYWASDPASHPELIEIVEIQEEARGKPATIVTHLPEGSEQNVLNFVNASIPGRGVRISVTRSNFDKVKEVVALPHDIEKPRTGIEGFSVVINSNGIFGFATVDMNESSPKINTLGANMRRGGHPEGETALGCQSGVMLTPLGLYSTVHAVNPDENYPFGDIIVPLESLTTITSPEEFIGRPAEELLKQVVVHNDETIKLAATEELNLYVIDGSKKIWALKVIRKDKNWLVSSLTEYRTEEQYAPQLDEDLLERLERLLEFF
jgi:hypothetical protein